MSATPVWAGVVVTSLVSARAWYAETTGAEETESGESWVTLRFDDGSGFELHEGHPEAPGLTFPSYGNEAGCAVMPGFAVDDADEVARGLTVARSLPGWIVVIAPGRLRVVLVERDTSPERGLCGFEFVSPRREALESFFSSIGAAPAVADGQRLEVVPVVAGDRDIEATDPDGNRLRIVRR